eukprot:scaffold5628_cov99-Amphora_coffeaeformis.AAC.1
MEAAEKTTTPEDEISIFDPSKCIDPVNEWLVLELPYLSLQEENGIQVPSLVPGPIFVPEGSREVSLVIFIRVKHCFAYTFERADATYHGQVGNDEKYDIEARCREQQIPFMEVTPKGRMWFLAG